jgi:glycosyltransferase involved in cell wall biosynthesis
MMKILFVSPCVGAHEDKFIRSLSYAGYRTHIFSFHGSPIDPAYGALPHVTVEYHRLRLVPRGQRFLPFHFFPRLKAAIRRFRPDLIHSGNTWNDSMLSALTGFHPLLVMPFGSDVLLDSQRSILFKTFNRIAFRGADWVTCDAETVKAKIVRDLRYPGEKITVIPWGIDVEGIARRRVAVRERIRAGLGWQDNFIVIMTRNHEPVYGVDVFLRAMEEVLQENPNVRVLVLGGGSLLQRHKEYVRARGLDRMFHWTGKVPHADLLDLLQGADLYASASWSDGASVSLMEAFASSLPVVVTDVPSIMEWVRPGENGESAPRGDHRRFAENVLALSKSASVARDYGRRSLQIVREKGDWGKNFAGIEQIYRHLADGK